MATGAPAPSGNADGHQIPATLPIIDTPREAHDFQVPTKCINEGHHVSRFLTSKAYRDICLFILQLNRSLCPRNQASSSIPRTFPLPSASSKSTTPSINALRTLLADIDGLIELAPPDPGPRRFGNVSFRKWYSLVEERLDAWLSKGRLGQTLQPRSDKGGSEENQQNVSVKDEVTPYLLGAFGSSQRLDYGTGHELSFLAFIGCLWKLGFFADGKQGGDIEREIVLQVIEPYLRVVRRIILTYTLEPAGSHGVWGLDDHSFMPYIFGSAQFTRPIDEDSPTRTPEPMPLEGSVRGAPKPSDVTKPAVVEGYRLTNMYFAAIGFINDVKKGPFWEHSPILFDISGIRDGWGKINKGMIKMFNAEVLSKFPVVQHFPFGSLFSWDVDPNAPLPTQSVHMVNQPVVTAATQGAPNSSQPPPPAPMSGTAAPWAQATRMPPPPGPGIPYSRVPPGPSSGSLATRQSRGDTHGSGSTAGHITVTKAPWAKDT